MAKRSREDFEPSSPAESPESLDHPSDSASIRLVNPSITVQPSKIQQVDRLESGEAASALTSSNTEMRCSLPPHKQTLSFASFEEFEVHYAKEHTHRCLECRKNFPTAHFLNLHIEENHDSLVVVRRERGEKTYNCFVVDCDRVCSTPQKRRMHLVDKHAFPKDYDFFIVNDGIDRRSSMLKSGRHRRGSSAALMQAEKARRRAGTLEGQDIKEDSKPANPPEEGDMDVDVKGEKNRPEGIPRESSSTTRKPQYSEEAMDDLVGGISSLKFIPPSVRFGRGRGRGGFSRT